jgi:UDPglucose 6-dehydrogenase
VMRIAVIGTGYVGLVSGLCFADKGHSVICVEKNELIVDKLNQSILTIYEPGLEKILERAIKKNLFFVTSKLEDALIGVDLVLICVGTPSLNGKIDLSQIVSCVQEIGSYIANNNKFLSVVIKSTVLPSTTDTMVRGILEDVTRKKFDAFGVGMNPEFLREGEAVHDFMNPDRIVIGFEDEVTKERLQELYAPWEVEKIFVSTRTAEMIKYASNVILATQISMINELANITFKIGEIDIADVIKGVTTDKRWNPILENSERANPKILEYLIPGCGFGGSCFPKDVQALTSMSQELGVNTKLLSAVMDVNAKQPHMVVEMLKTKFSLKHKRILVLGLAFKPETDDVRETASYKIIKDLAGEKSVIYAHDPVAISSFQLMYPDLNEINYSNTWTDLIKLMEVVIIATNWREYAKVTNHINDNQYIFDIRRLLKKENFANYMSIGLS